MVMVVDLFSFGMASYARVANMDWLGLEGRLQPLSMAWRMKNCVGPPLPDEDFTIRGTVVFHSSVARRLRDSLPLNYVSAGPGKRCARISWASARSCAMSQQSGGFGDELTSATVCLV
jgi:hypothetical protein